MMRRHVHTNVFSAISVVAIFYLRATSSSVAAEPTTAAARFKAPHSQTSAAQAQQWQREDEALWKYVEEHVPAVLDHTGSAAFDEHLKGVQAVLRFWEAPEHLCRAGLFHSIYGTEGFQGFSLPLSERSKIRSLIGERAEKLAFVFCMVDRSTFDKTVFDWTPPSTTVSSSAKNGRNVTSSTEVYNLRARPELGRFDIQLTKDEWVDFVTLTLADWLEQVEGAAAKPNPTYGWEIGQAYAYRRTAYHKMSIILQHEREGTKIAEVAPKMLEAVMATEGPESRNLVQMRTPPMARPAAEALAALRAAGENIPENLAPLPMEECLSL